MLYSAFNGSDKRQYFYLGTGNIHQSCKDEVFIFLLVETGLSRLLLYAIHLNIIIKKVE